jgi:hypothetical protein
MTAKIIKFPIKKKDPDPIEILDSTIELTPREEAVLFAVKNLEAKKPTEHMAKILAERDAYHKGCGKISAPDNSFTIYLDNAPDGRPRAKYYRGKAVARNPSAFYRYRNAEDRDVGIAKFIYSTIKADLAKKKYAEEKKARGRGLEIGDILVSMWGYEQTNVDFYEVTALVGKTMVEITPIAGCAEHEAMDRGTVKPVPGAYTGEPIRKKAREGYISLSSYSGASLADFELVEGVKVYRSYGWSSYH